LASKRKFVTILSYLVMVVALTGGVGLSLFHVSASSGKDAEHKLLSPNMLTPTPTPPTDNTIGLSATSGPPGTHIFIAASGYQPREQVQEVWNYQGPGTGISQHSFYYFNPIGTADANGVVYESFNAPFATVGTYPIAAIGLKSHIVKTATFQLVPALDLGLYVGLPGSVLRFNGWGFASREIVTLYWNWTPTSIGQKITTATADTYGNFGKRTFAIPSGTANGTYTLAAIGNTSNAIAQAQFSVGSLTLNAPPPGPSDWPSFGYDLQSTRVNPAETTISPANVATLSVKWKSPTPVPYNVTGSAITVNGVVYVGTVEGMVIAYDATTGNVLWTFYTRGPVYGSPTVVNGIAYFGSVNYPTENLIGNFAYALNADTGSLIWENYLPNGGEWITPLVANGRVFFTSAGKEGISGGFSAFDAYTGATLWSLSTNYGIWAPDTLDPTGTNLYVDTGNPCFTEPIPTNCGGYVEDLNPATGQTIWQIHLQDVSGDDDVPTAPVYNNGRLYLGGKNGIFYCVDATNGNILWQYNTGNSGDNGIFSSAAFYDNKVFFGGGDNLVHALNLDGSVAWTFQARSGIISSPSIANGILFVGGEDRTFYALDTETGTKLWSYTTGGPILSSPTISNGVVYITSFDGNVYAFSPAGM
jgi:outer membrane protein assembly factor BamB